MGTTPDITQRSDKTYAIDYGPPGPFLILTYDQVQGLVTALYDADMLAVQGVVKSGRRT